MENSTSSLSPAHEALAQFGLERITCEWYAPVHTLNAGCSTSLPLSADIAAHVNLHGGCFHLTLKEGSSEEFWRKWAELEVVDLRCGTCGEMLHPQAQTIALHLQPHLDRNRRMSHLRQILITLKG